MTDTPRPDRLQPSPAGHPDQQAGLGPPVTPTCSPPNPTGSPSGHPDRHPSGYPDQGDRPVGPDITNPPSSAATTPLTGHGDRSPDPPDRSGGSGDDATDETKRWSIPWWVDHISMWPLTAVVSGFCAKGQHDFARGAGIEDPGAWFATALFEFLMVGFFARGWLRAREGQSPMMFWAIATVVGAGSLWAQLEHSADIKQQILYGGATVGLMLLWIAKMYDSYREYLRRKNKVITPMPKFGRAWLLSPGRAWRGLLIATEIGIDDVRVLLDYASTWRTTMRTIELRNRASKARLDEHKRACKTAAKNGNSAPPPLPPHEVVIVSRDLAKLTASNAVNARAGRTLVELPSVVVAQLNLVDRPTPPPVQAAATVGVPYADTRGDMVPAEDAFDALSRSLRDGPRPPVTRRSMQRSHQQEERPALPDDADVVDAVPVSPAVGSPRFPDEETLDRWRTQTYAPHIAAVKAQWRDKRSGLGWADAGDPPPASAIRDICEAALGARPAQPTALNIQKVLIADRLEEATRR